MNLKMKKGMVMSELQAIFDQAAGLALDALEGLTAARDKEKGVRLLETILTICEAGSAKAETFELDGKAPAKA